MLYFMFYSRKLKRRFVKRIKEVQSYSYEWDDSASFEELRLDDRRAYSQAKMLTQISQSHLFLGGDEQYFSSGEAMRDAIIKDLEMAQRFILLEYFIIEEGSFWNSVLEVLKRKVKEGVDVRVMYDDIGCMGTLPGNYDRILNSYGIKTVVFSKLRGSADSELNNRNHRKILVVDGVIGYTGGVNIADEYVNEKKLYGHWKDGGIRLRGVAVRELTKMALMGYGMNSKELPELPPLAYPDISLEAPSAYLIPYGDGPRPIYKRNVSKAAIQNMLGAALDYVYMTTPYLIIDNDICSDIERAALRGVDVRIIVPHVPDKKLVFAMTRSYYNRLMDAGVKIYEYEPGFIHAKTYVADGKYAIVGTVNLDYRSLVHHFEDGVWMYKTDCISDIKRDLDETLEKSIRVTPDMLKMGRISRLIRSMIRIFAPML
jgi:cardiolipin synthase